MKPQPAKQKHTEGVNRRHLWQAETVAPEGQHGQSFSVCCFCFNMPWKTWYWVGVGGRYAKSKSSFHFWKVGRRAHPQKPKGVYPAAHHGCILGKKWEVQSGIAQMPVFKPKMKLGGLLAQTSHTKTSTWSCCWVETTLNLPEHHMPQTTFGSALTGHPEDFQACGFEWKP